MFVPSIVTSINDVRLNLIALLSRLSLLMRFTSEFSVQLVIFLNNKNKKYIKTGRLLVQIDIAIKEFPLYASINIYMLI